jgi:FtsZ-binding cell division protein ZapB
MTRKEIEDRMRILMETCWRLSNEIDELKNKINRLEQEHFGNEYDEQIEAYYKTQLDDSSEPYVDRGS